jgi:hypothetical protein
MNNPPKLFLLERRNQRFLDDRGRWTSQLRRSAARLVIAGAICLCISFVLLANHRETVGLLIGGKKTDAIVVSKRVDPGTDNHYIRYRFSADSAATPTEVEKGTSQRLFDSKSVGSVVPVLYNPRTPSRCLVGEEIASSSKDRAILFGWFLFSVLLLAYMVFDFRTNSVLRSKGIVLTGSLRTLKSSQHDVESPSEVTVLYTFKGPSGNMIEAQAKGRTSRTNVSNFAELAGEGGQQLSVAALYVSDQEYILL